MNAKQFVKMWVAVLLLSPALVLGQLTRDPGLQRLQPLPDLMPLDMTLGADCRMIVAVRNNGPGAVPDAGYSLTAPGASEVQMFKDGAPWGGIILGGLDTAHSTQPAGGIVTYAFPTLVVPAGTHTIQINVDQSNTIVENNEVNNSLTKTLTCQPPLPDLQPISFTLQPTGTIRANGPCQIVITLKNNGPGTVPDAAFVQTAAGPGVQMYADGAPWGGIILGGIDPTKQLQPVGGTVTWPWFGGTANLFLAPGTHTLRLDVDNTNIVGESNEGNNSLTQTVTCGLTVLQP